MKRSLKFIASLCLVVLSLNVSARDTGHSMSPFKAKQYVYNDTLVKRYKINNDTSTPTTYQMVVEDYYSKEREVTEQFVTVPAYSSRSVMVKLKNIPADTKVTKYVCSWSVADSSTAFRSEICALLQLYYPLSYLQQRQQQQHQ